MKDILYYASVMEDSTKRHNTLIKLKNIQLEIDAKNKEIDEAISYKIKGGENYIDMFINNLKNSIKVLRQDIARTLRAYENEQN